MPRRGRSRIHPLWIVAAIVLIAAAIGGGVLFFSNVSDPYRTLTPLDVPAYLESSNSLRGNVYRLDAVVEGQLTWSPTSGRLYSVEVRGPESDLLPVLIPAELNHMNIQKGQRFYFRLEVGDKGILHVQDMRKV